MSRAKGLTTCPVYFLQPREDDLLEYAVVLRTLQLVEDRAARLLLRGIQPGSVCTLWFARKPSS